MRLAGVTCWLIRSMNQVAPGSGRSAAVSCSTGIASSADQLSRPAGPAA